MKAFSFIVLTLLFLVSFSCGGEDESWRDQTWLYEGASTDELMRGTVFRFSDDTTYVHNRYRQESEFTLPLVDSAAALTATDTAFYVFHPGKSPEISREHRDSTVYRVPVVPHRIDTFRMSDWLKAGHTYRVFTQLDTFLIHYNTQENSDRGNHFMSYHDRGRLQAGEIPYPGLGTGMDIFLTDIDERGRFELFSISRFHQYRITRLDCRCLPRPPDAEIGADVDVDCLQRSPANDSTSAQQRLLFRRLPPIVPPEISPTAVVELLNTGGISIRHWIDEYTEDQVNYEYEEDFYRRNGIAYAELDRLSFDFAPDGVFTLLAGNRSVNEGQWELAPDRRYLLVRHPKQSQVTVIPIRSWSEGSITVEVPVKVATPRNYGVNMMSYVRSRVEMTIQG